MSAASRSAAQPLSFEQRRYDDPDVQALVAQVQAEYVRLYGGPDHSPIDPDEFAPPCGVFLLGLLGDEPAAMGGWRWTSEVPGTDGSDDSDPRTVEIRRMFVTPAHRGAGYSRALLDELERTAARAGAVRVVLETGPVQVAAVALYESHGYRRIGPYGYYADAPDAIFYAKQL